MRKQELLPYEILSIIEERGDVTAQWPFSDVVDTRSFKPKGEVLVGEHIPQLMGEAASRIVVGRLVASDRFARIQLKDAELGIKLHGKTESSLWQELSGVNIAVQGLLGRPPRTDRTSASLEVEKVLAIEQPLCPRTWGEESPGQEGYVHGRISNHPAKDGGYAVTIDMREQGSVWLPGFANLPRMQPQDPLSSEFPAYNMRVRARVVRGGMPDRFLRREDDYYRLGER